MADYSKHFSIPRLWFIFLVNMAVMFGTLIYFGAQIYQSKPPLPSALAFAGFMPQAFLSRPRTAPI